MSPPGNNRRVAQVSLGPRQALVSALFIDEMIVRFACGEEHRRPEMSFRYRFGRRMRHGTQVGRYSVPCTCSSTRRLARLLRSFSLPLPAALSLARACHGLGKPRILLRGGMHFGVPRADRAGLTSASQAGGLRQKLSWHPLRQRPHLPRLFARTTFPTPSRRPHRWKETTPPRQNPSTPLQATLLGAGDCCWVHCACEQPPRADHPAALLESPRKQVSLSPLWSTEHGMDPLFTLRTPWTCHLSRRPA